jgi:hypothetical protein
LDKYICISSFSTSRRCLCTRPPVTPPTLAPDAQTAVTAFITVQWLFTSHFVNNYNNSFLQTSAHINTMSSEMTRSATIPAIHTLGFPSQQTATRLPHCDVMKEDPFRERGCWREGGVVCSCSQSPGPGVGGGSSELRELELAEASLTRNANQFTCH